MFHASLSLSLSLSLSRSFLAELFPKDTRTHRIHAVVDCTRNTRKNKHTRAFSRNNSIAGRSIGHDSTRFTLSTDQFDSLSLSLSLSVRSLLGRPFFCWAENVRNAFARDTLEQVAVSVYSLKVAVDRDSSIYPFSSFHCFFSSSFVSFSSNHSDIGQHTRRIKA